MPSPPGGANVTCPACDAVAVAIVPRDSTIVEDKAAADGKVWVYCRTCDHRFLVHYRERRDDEGPEDGR